MITAPVLTPAPDGIEITVADSGNAAIVFDALAAYADAYIDKCSQFSEIASDPAKGIIHLGNAVETTGRICGMLDNLSTVYPHLMQDTTNEEN